MKGCFSLLLALIVLAALLAGGYWLYTKTKEGDERLAPSGPGQPTLTIENQTSFVLTVQLTKTGKVERFQVGPGQSEKRSVDEGTYTVAGQITDPDTSSFTGEWTFESGRNYTAGFTRSGDGTLALVGVRPGQ